MKGSEAERKLAKLGWTHVRRTGQGHDIWQSPSGERRMFALAHGLVDRNVIARIRQAERAANLEEDLMTTTSLDQVERAVPTTVVPAQAPARPKLRVYRSGGATRFAEVYWGEAEARVLGWPETVDVSPAQPYDVGDEPNAWRLTPGGKFKVRKYDRGKTPYYAISVKALADALPATGRTELPAEELGGGFLLFLDRVVPVPVLPVGKKPRQAPPEPRQASTAPAQVVTSPNGPSPSGDALAALETTSSPKRADQFDDLRAAMDMVRGALAELGGSLHTQDGAPIDLRSVQVTVTKTVTL